MSEPMFEDVYRTVRDAEDRFFDLSITFEDVHGSIEEMFKEVHRAVRDAERASQGALDQDSRNEYAAVLRRLASELDGTATVEVTLSEI